jgi:hypothetical protein
MMEKRGQTWSLETYLAIAIFLTALIFFYSLTTVERFSSNVAVEVERVGKSLITSEQLKDGQLSQGELAYFVNMSCDDLKVLFHTNNELCIYFKDAQGNLITNASRIVYGIGCDSINISGKRCGTVEMP